MLPYRALGAACQTTAPKETWGSAARGVRKLFFHEKQRFTPEFAALEFAIAEFPVYVPPARIACEHVQPDPLAPQLVRAIGFHGANRALSRAGALGADHDAAAFDALAIGFEYQDEIAGELRVRVNRQVDDVVAARCSSSE